MRLIHTSDWHLGHTLREQSREEEHGAFLAWLLDQLVATEADALLIAGDVFDQANPPSSAQRRFYRFLAQARARCPDLDIVVIGGNHDSAPRLDAPRPLFDVAEVHVVGGLPRRTDRTVDLDRLVVPLHNRQGAVAAWVVAMPFLRPSDLPRVDHADPLVGGVEALYNEAFQVAALKRTEGQALVAMGHCYLAGTSLSEWSERKILGGNQHALPASIFSSEIGYVALGHLHLAQQVDHDHIRYSGSPIPLSMGEAGYPHQVLMVDLEGAKCVGVTPLLIPRSVELIRLEPGEIGDVLAQLVALPNLPAGMQHWQRPFLEVTVYADGPTPDLRATIDGALEGKAARLVALKPIRNHEDSSLADAVAQADLQHLSEEAVLRKLWSSRHAGEPSTELLATFHELLDQVRSAEAG